MTQAAQKQDAPAPAQQAPSGPKLRAVRVTVPDAAPFPWAGRTWPSGTNDTQVDPATAADLAIAPTARLRVEWLDGDAPKVHAEAPIRRPTQAEELTASNEREQFFRTKLAAAEVSFKVEIERMQKKHAAELDTERARARAAIQEAETRAANAEAERDDLLTKEPSNAEPFQNMPNPPRAPQRGGR